MLITVFMWGDPHFRSVDDNAFTFNGIGDYVLIESEENGLKVHGRFTRYNNTNATVMTALAVKQGMSQVVRVEVESETLQLYIGDSDSAIAIPENNSGLWITDTQTFTDTIQLGPLNLTSMDLIIIRPENDTLLLSTPAGASISVSTQLSFLHSSVGFTEDTFVNLTEGLLGNYNMDASDDFRLPNGTILPEDLSEREVYYQFGLECKCNSLFPYGACVYASLLGHVSKIVSILSVN